MWLFLAADDNDAFEFNTARESALIAYAHNNNIINNNNNNTQLSDGQISIHNWAVFITDPNKKCGHRVQPTWYVPASLDDTGTALGQDGSDWSRDLVTLIFDLVGHGACGWCGSSSSIRVPGLKFVSLAVWKIWRTMCVSINGPGDLDLWPFDIETGMRVAPKVGNLPSKFGHARPLGSRIIRYVRDRRSDRQTKVTLIAPFPMVGA